MPTVTLIAEYAVSDAEAAVSADGASAEILFSAGAGKPVRVKMRRQILVRLLKKISAALRETKRPARKLRDTPAGPAPS